MASREGRHEQISEEGAHLRDTALLLSSAGVLRGLRLHSELLQVCVAWRRKSAVSAARWPLLISLPRDSSSQSRKMGGPKFGLLPQAEVSRPAAPLTRCPPFPLAVVLLEVPSTHWTQCEWCPWTRAAQ